MNKELTTTMSQKNLLYRANMEIFACLWTDDLSFFLRQGSRDGQVLLWGVCLFL